MVPNAKKEGWHYLAVKKLSALLHRINSNNMCEFYCVNCLRSFRAENRLESHERVCKNKDFFEIAMPSEKGNTLKFNKYMKPDKMPYIIFAYIELFIKKIDRCAKNQESSSTTNLVENIPCGQPMSTILAFHNIKTNILCIVGKIV